MVNELCVGISSIVARIVRKVFMEEIKLEYILKDTMGPLETPNVLLSFRE